MKKIMTNGKNPPDQFVAKTGVLSNYKENWNEFRNNQLMLWTLDGLPLVDVCWFSGTTWEGVVRQVKKIAQKYCEGNRSGSLVEINVKGLTIRDGVPLTPADWWVISVCLNKTGLRWGAGNYPHMARCLFRSYKEFFLLVHQEIDNQPGFFHTKADDLVTLRRIADHRKKKFEDYYHRRIRQRFESDQTNDPEAIEERYEQAD